MFGTKIESYEKQIGVQARAVESFVDTLHSAKENAQQTKSNVDDAIARLKSVRNRCDTTVRFVDGILKNVK